MGPAPDDAEIDPADARRLGVLLSELDEADFERVDPPDELWGRIAASVAAETSGTPPGAGTVVEYAIDADDVVTAIDGDWSTFARENDAPELAETTPARSLWSYFDNDEVRDLWRLLVERVRVHQASALVPLRCDAPDARRWFEMTVTPAADGAVHFRCVLVFEEERQAVPFLGLDVQRDREASPIPVCSWCGKGHDGAGWRDIEDLVRERRLLEGPMPSISHGICPTCRARMAADLLVPEDTDRSPG
jgi:hypothetical protein